MKKAGTFVTAALAGLFLVTVFGVENSFGATAPGLTRTHSGGGVTVKVTYLNLQGTDDARFQVVLDTHSVNLDAYNMKTLSVLRDETGKSYEPSQVENEGSGHHREVTLIFPKPSAEAKKLELIVKDVAKVKERSFRWELQ